MMRNIIEGRYRATGSNLDLERRLKAVTGSIGQVEDEMDKARVALGKLINPRAYAESRVPAFKSLPEAYVHFSGDPDVSGRFFPERVLTGLRASQEFSAGSFANALANALNVVLFTEYVAQPYYEHILISARNPVENLRGIRSVQLGYFADIEELDPETGDYSDVESISEKAANYWLRQTGAIMSVTRRIIMNDAVGLIKKMVARLARAARKTHARYVWSFVVNNAITPDGTAWFTTDHGNLGASALDFAPLTSAITALATMQEEEPSGDVMGINLASFNWYLAVSTTNWDLAVKKNQAQYTGADFTPNPCYRLFGDHNERIIPCPFFTGVNDWGVFREPRDVGIVEMSYLFGKEDPEFMVQEGPEKGHVFTRDRISYKIRHEYGGAVVDYRGGYKSIVV